uniref:Polycomb protein VEFS-Box domain-containing protein n=1 Tax=Chaetoceros debilis TaxID=122233 RepID=A0A7S3V785_9STRA
MMSNCKRDESSDKKEQRIAVDHEASHSFLQLFQSTAILGKALELRWFGNNNPTNTPDSASSSTSAGGGGGRSQKDTRDRRRMQQHLTRMPFLIRNFQHHRCRPLSSRSVNRRREQLRNTRSKLKNINDMDTRKINILDGDYKYSRRCGQKAVEVCASFSKCGYSSKGVTSSCDASSVVKLPPKPRAPRHAFELFSTRNPRYKNKTEVELVEVWNCKLSDEETNNWVRKEIWDRRRYLYEKKIYDSCKFRAQKGFAIFSYFYFNKHNGTRGSHRYDDKSLVLVQLEKRTDRRCPFCYFDGITNRGLLLHLNTVHGSLAGDSHIVFNGGIDADNNLHISVKSFKRPRNRRMTLEPGADEFMYMNTHRYCSIIDNRPDIEQVAAKQFKIPFVSKPLHLTCLMDPAAKKKKIRQLEQQMNHNKQNGVSLHHPKTLSQYYPTKPIRQYYHSRTLQPMGSGDWDIDSDDEDDDEWKISVQEGLMNELDDVAGKEKIFMNIWNRFIHSHSLVSDSVIPRKCEEFLMSNLSFLKESSLRQQFLLHLFNMWDNSLISSKAIITLMGKFDAYSLNSKRKPSETDRSSRDSAPVSGKKRKTESEGGNTHLELDKEEVSATFEQEEIPVAAASAVERTDVTGEAETVDKKRAGTDQRDINILTIKLNKSNKTDSIDRCIADSSNADHCIDSISKKAGDGTNKNTNFQTEKDSMCATKVTATSLEIADAPIQLVDNDINSHSKCDSNAPTNERDVDASTAPIDTSTNVSKVKFPPVELSRSDHSSKGGDVGCASS